MSTIAWKRGVVVASSVAELVCAVGLLAPTTRRAAGKASAALLLAVWPANVQMSVDLGRRALEKGDAASIATFVVSALRLPVQVPLVRAALHAR